MPRVGSTNRPARPRLIAGWVTLGLVCGAAFTGCSSQDAAPLASQACAHVERALTAAHKAAAAGPSEAAQLQSEVVDQVRAALPFAARAAGDNTTWQPLDATLSESNRVPVRLLLPALAAQCAGVAG
jgi:hypothetical protein